MQEKGKIIKCEVCGKEYYLIKSRLEKSKHHFCSKECYYKFERPAKKQNALSIYRTITRNGKIILEHRYIMEQHLGRKLGKKEYVHHKNGNKHDNRLENLEVLSPSEHNKHHFEKLPKTKICVICGKKFEPPVNHRGRNKICSKECWLIFAKKSSPFQNIKIGCYKNNILIKKYNSIKEAAIDMNGTSSNIVKSLKGHTKSAYGYQWKYL